MPILEESVPTPLVYERTMESMENFQIEEHPRIPFESSVLHCTVYLFSIARDSPFFVCFS